MNKFSFTKYDLYIKNPIHQFATDNAYINYEAYAEDYDFRYETEMCRQENNAIKELFFDVHNNTINITNKRIIDLGCGTGLLLDLLGPYISQSLYTGIDICGEMTEKAAIKYPFSKFITEDAAVAIKRIQSKQDIIVSLFSIPYIGISTIEDAYELLKPGGVLFSVFYRCPYLNPSSVYADKKEHYIADVLPKVNKCIEKADQLFVAIYKGWLTFGGAYDVAIYQKA